MSKYQEVCRWCKQRIPDYMSNVDSGFNKILWFFYLELWPVVLYKVSLSGVYSAWTDWSRCSVTCAESTAAPGVKSRTQTCKEDCADVEKIRTEEKPCWGEPDPTFCSTGLKNITFINIFNFLLQTAAFSPCTWNKPQKVAPLRSTSLSRDQRGKVSQKLWW